MPATSARSPSLLGEVVRGWDRFWFTPADPTTLAFIRVCCGLLVFYVHLTYSWDLFSYVGAWGVRAAGFAFVALDLEGYRSGSLHGARRPGPDGA